MKNPHGTRIAGWCCIAGCWFPPECGNFIGFKPSPYTWAWFDIPLDLFSYYQCTRFWSWLTVIPLIRRTGRGGSKGPRVCRLKMGHLQPVKKRRKTFLENCKQHKLPKSGRVREKKMLTLPQPNWRSEGHRTLNAAPTTWYMVSSHLLTPRMTPAARCGCPH